MSGDGFTLHLWFKGGLEIDGQQLVAASVQGIVGVFSASGNLSAYFVISASREGERGTEESGKIFVIRGDRESFFFTSTKHLETLIHSA